MCQLTVPRHIRSINYGGSIQVAPILDPCQPNQIFLFLWEIITMCYIHIETEFIWKYSNKYPGTPWAQRTFSSINTRHVQVQKWHPCILQEKNPTKTKNTKTCRDGAKCFSSKVDYFWTQFCPVLWNTVDNSFTLFSFFVYTGWHELIS